MATCAWCQRSGFFLSVNRHLLCDACATRAQHELARKLEILGESCDLARTGKKLDTRLSRLELALSIVEELKPYAERGMDPFTPSLASFLRKWTPYRTQIIKEEMEAHISAVRTKAAAGATPKTRAAAIRRGLPKAHEILAFAANEPEIEGLVRSLEGDAELEELQAILENAERAEFKSQKSKALGYYQDALFFVMNDGFHDSAQADVIQQIRAKISELGGDVAPPTNKVTAMPSLKFEPSE